MLRGGGARPSAARHGGDFYAAHHGFEFGRNLYSRRQVEFAVGQICKTRQQIKAEQLGCRQRKVREPVGVHGNTLQLGDLLPERTFDGDAGVSLVAHDRGCHR